ncbi:MAG: nitrile hydratase subunit alpha [Chloroflexi bacterium]|nr:nitrile hydratase subunit alpha [Chloroflexota bacterium]
MTIPHAPGNGHGGHDHEEHPGMAHDEELGYYAVRAKAMEALLVQKGICSPDEIQGMVDRLEARSPSDGARVVARAWADPAFKSLLLSDPEAALVQLGYSLPETTPKLDVVENTNELHHLVVCTLCSCYPRALLGRPPDWYKSLAYRSRAVVDPRGVISEFGLDLADDVEVRVLDSTADLRYLVLPRRPEGTEGMSEEELAGLVTRDSMIGVTDARSPQAAHSG